MRGTLPRCKPRRSLSTLLHMPARLRDCYDLRAVLELDRFQLTVPEREIFGQSQNAEAIVGNNSCLHQHPAIHQTERLEPGGGIKSAFLQNGAVTHRPK